MDTSERCFSPMQIPESAPIKEIANAVIQALNYAKNTSAEICVKGRRVTVIFHNTGSLEDMLKAGFLTQVEVHTKGFKYRVKIDENVPPKYAKLIVTL